jgi:hypothetical protein
VSFHADATRKERVQGYLGKLLPGFQVNQLDAGNLEDVEQSVSMHAHGKTPQFARQEGDSTSIPVGPDKYFVKEFAPSSQRKLDLRFLAQTTSVEDWTVHLPPTAQIKSAPTPAHGTSPFGAFDVTVETSGNAVHVRTTISRTQTRIAASDYHAFQTFCESIDRALGQRVIVGLK